MTLVFDCSSMLMYRSPWYNNWRKKVCDTLQNLVLEGTPELCFLDAQGFSLMLCLLLVNSS